jgi:hypothetical protein
MRPIGDTGFDAKTTAANAAWRARALEKPKAAADLNGKSGGEPEQQPQQKSENAQMLSPRYGTQPHVPFRHAPRLTAAFTAQLLGQILPDPERHFSGLKSAQGYGSEPAPAPCFDAKL